VVQTAATEVHPTGFLQLYLRQRRRAWRQSLLAFSLALAGFTAWLIATHAWF
jgi:hypothetical protein